MKKIILLLSMIFVASSSFAQETSTDENESKSKTEYNKFSIEAAVGLNRPDDNFSPGYFSSDPSKVFPLNSVNHYNLGVRYMLNERFGLKIDGAYDVFEPESNSSNSLPFEAIQYRVGLQGVVNLRNLLNFDTFTKRFGLLGHAGIQVNWLQPESRNGVDLSDRPSDQNGGFIFGLTPQYRLTNRFVLTADATFLHNYRTHITWDGQRSTDSNLTSNMLNVSLGLTVYLGKHDVHADWVVVENDYATKDDVNALKNRLDDIEKGLKDDDGDGVPNYLDKDPNTPAGAIVNSHGQAVDTNGNGIPDHLEGPLDARYKNMDVIKDLANRGAIAVYFDFDVSVPQESSYSSIKTVLTYMRENQDAKLTVTGYADELGTEDYNNPLSKKRADKVRDILVLAGVDSSRITTVGGGEDRSVDKNSEFARQLVRRATFTIE